MTNPRFPFDEFRALFSDKFASQEEMLREYDSFLSVLTHLDEARVPEMSAGQKAEIFRQAWQGRRREQPAIWSWLAWLRQPAVTFALGLVLGCILMSVGTGGPDLLQPVSAQDMLAVERTRYTQTYRGAAIDALYPELENPKMVVERSDESAAPQRVLYGTLDDGEIYVVWNL